jgi:hypothetical protein
VDEGVGKMVKAKTSLWRPFAFVYDTLLRQRLNGFLQ